jgi:tRNA pseudouridine55 synthase
MSEILNGVVVVDKPVGPTSFAIVHQARRLTGARKVGHGGTLDPAASGVLPICFGEGTKIAQFLLDADKEYEAVVRLGVATDSYDATGNITARRAAGHLAEANVAGALDAFRGWIAQTPPVFSALKRDGRPLYSYARAGEAVTVEARQVRIDTLELAGFDTTNHAEPTARLRVVCSKGTYIRSLAHDLGARLGVGAHLEALRRTRSGPFGLEQAIPPADLAKAGEVIVSPARALAALPAMTISVAGAAAVSEGRAICWRDLGPCPATDGPVCLLGEDGALVAVAIAAGPEERVRTHRVFGREG